MPKTSFQFFLAGLLSMSVQSHAATVYVENNQPDQNAILAYDLKADGTLEAKASYATSGKGVVDSSFALGPFDADQQIITNDAKTLLFAVNSGSNSIAVFHVSSDGTLTAVAGSPFDSHGSDPVSVGLKGNQLIVVNKHNDPAQASDASLPNYTTFKVAANGALTWSGQVTEVANGSSPSQALIAPYSYFVFGADFLGGIFRSFQLYGNGALGEVSTLGIPASEYASPQTPRLPLGLAANPKLPLVYVGLVTANKIAVYHYNYFGDLKFLDSVADSGNGVCWLKTNRAGTRLYASNTGDPSITVYDIATSPKAPKEIQKVLLNTVGGGFEIALSTAEDQLVVLTQRDKATIAQGQGNGIHVLAIDKNGLLSPSAATTLISLPGDTRPQGLLAL